MNINFELILFYATVIAGVIALADIMYFAPRRQSARSGSSSTKMPILFEYARSFFPILLIVFLLRSFLFEPFRIPSGSLEPTLLTGDFILVNKYDYGIRLPVWHKEVMPMHTPARGDIMIFRWPPNQAFNFIKRVIGLPGDHVSYINKSLIINGEVMPQKMLRQTSVENETGTTWMADEKEENLLGIRHKIYIDPNKPSHDFQDIIVPPGMYFVMGDNRDDSADSRYWGFVPNKNIVGKAVLIWMSWNGHHTAVRWNRIGSTIH